MKYTPLKVSELNKTELYLAMYRFNSKKITWQMCRVINTVINKNKNGYDTIQVLFWDGTVKNILVNAGECVNSIGQLTLKPIGNWLKNEITKLYAEKNSIQEKITKMENFSI